ncbi:MAG: hypothetical protein ACLU18_14015 [Bacteroides thetaiotaomicron]
MGKNKAAAVFDDDNDRGALAQFADRLNCNVLNQTVDDEDRFGFGLRSSHQLKMMDHGCVDAYASASTSAA